MIIYLKKKSQRISSLSLAYCMNLSLISKTSIWWAWILSIKSATMPKTIKWGTWRLWSIRHRRRSKASLFQGFWGKMWSQSISSSNYGPSNHRWSRKFWTSFRIWWVLIILTPKKSFFEKKERKLMILNANPILLITNSLPPHKNILNGNAR